MADERGLTEMTIDKVDAGKALARLNERISFAVQHILDHPDIQGDRKIVFELTLTPGDLSQMDMLAPLPGKYTVRCKVPVPTHAMSAVLLNGKCMVPEHGGDDARQRDIEEVTGAAKNVESLEQRRKANGTTE